MEQRGMGSNYFFQEQIRRFTYEGNVYALQHGGWHLDRLKDWNSGPEATRKVITDKKLIRELEKLKALEDL